MDFTSYDIKDMACQFADKLLGLQNQPLVNQETRDFVCPNIMDLGVFYM